MPAYLRSFDRSDVVQSTREWFSGGMTRTVTNQSTQHITIALVNNMPDGALLSTERQFLSLLDIASGNLQVGLCLYSMSDIRRKGSAASHVRMHYSEVDDLWGSRIDGIIVTGREPLASSLIDEPYWKNFTMLVDWAREHTYSAVWSCLAAHAALLHCDGICRVKSPIKKCGIFDCSRVEDHPLTAGLGLSFKLPHSRWNGVSETALKNSGYQILSRSEAGADIFAKAYQSLFLYFQGHPEYEFDTLRLEYRRDVGRFLKGESEIYPSLPKQYFDAEMSATLEAFREEAMRHPRRELLKKLYGILMETGMDAPWHSVAVHIYRNWLQYIAAEKEKDLAAESRFQRTNWSKLPVVPIGAANHSLSSGYIDAGAARRERPRRVAGAR